MTDKHNLHDPYFSQYQDRGIQKWTGFFLSEHTAQIAAIDKENEIIPRLSQQSQSEIEFYLERSIKYNKMLEIQLNSLTYLGNVKQHVYGTFRGMSNREIAMIGNRYIPFADIRHIKVHNFLKWSDMDSKDEVEESPFDGFVNDDGLQEFNDDYWDDAWSEEDYDEQE